MSHPNPDGIFNARPFEVGDELVKPVTGEFARILELSWQHPEHRVRAELLAVAGARVVGEHLHPGSTERFTVLDGEPTVRLDGRTTKFGGGGNRRGGSGTVA